MAKTDAIVLGAGIVGTSIALHLQKRGLAVALVDRRGPGEGTSYGNAGVIEGNTLFPHAFPSGLMPLLRVALKQASEANYHLSFLPWVAPWLWEYRQNTQLAGRMQFAKLMRPLFERALAEHEELMAESKAERYLRKTGWLKLYRTEAAFADTAPERKLATQLQLPHQVLDSAGARALEPALAPVFHCAIHWSGAASIGNPLAVTQAYAMRFVDLGGALCDGNARTLRRAGENWRVNTDRGEIDARMAIVALGPWSPDVLEPLGIKLPLAVKRGYHWHFEPRGNTGLNRPVVDVEFGYCVAPMEHGLRITTGAEFARRDAPPTPVQFNRLLPKANELFPLGEPLELSPWLGARPCFSDSRPVIGRAPAQRDLWLAYGHAHWGLTLGPVTGHLLADMITGVTPFCDPKPFAAERFH
ncbi:MAG TPA: FAD-dependent oxidoreductase [Xanthobacteraceae bacterium]|nr:FAD-dependent oxidoreductase [Xanthobacteraceae bacterium]